MCGMLRHDGIVPMPWELFGIFECYYDRVIPNENDGSVVVLNCWNMELTVRARVGVMQPRLSLCHALIGMGSGSGVLLETLIWFLVSHL